MALARHKKPTPPRASASVLIALALATVTAWAPAAKTRPGASLDWAYPNAATGTFPALPAGPLRVPGGAVCHNADQVNDDANPPDWNPEAHPSPPAIVAHQRPGAPTPCAACHLINGQGFLGVPSLAGLPPAYILEQIGEFRSGRRQSWRRDRQNPLEMIKVAQTVTNAEAASAAAYFASLPKRPWFRVVETRTVPATRQSKFGWVDLVPGGPPEPIRGRVIEVPEDTLRTFLQDPRSGVVAYVPVGSLARGAALVHSGGAAGQPCAACHGADLRGLGDTPPLAGRSPSYLARMLWDIKTGSRRGPAVAQMQGPAKGLDEANITDIAAYLASLKP
jgi:cytochrome c553